jgi:hypothetical protein
MNKIRYIKKGTIQPIRRIVLKIFKATAVDIKIKHHLPIYKFLLNTYHHFGSCSFLNEKAIINEMVNLHDGTK